MKPMTKTDLITAVAEQQNLPKKDVEAVINATLATIENAVAKGQAVQFVGFGTFEPRIRSGRKGRNLHTGETIEIAEKTVPAFKAGKHFKDIVEAGGDIEA